MGLAVNLPAEPYRLGVANFDSQRVYALVVDKTLTRARKILLNVLVRYN